MKTTLYLLNEVVGLGFKEDEALKSIDAALDQELGIENRKPIEQEKLSDELYKDILYGFKEELDYLPGGCLSDQKIIILSEGHEGDRHIISFSDAIKEIKDIVDTNGTEYEDYLTNNDLDDTDENYNQFKNDIIKSAKNIILEGYEYFISGVTYKLLKDELIESLWDELTDVPFDESENDLVLSEDWFIFDKGTERGDIWHWFDEHYSKGVGWLMNMKSNYNEDKIL